MNSNKYDSTEPTNLSKAVLDRCIQKGVFTLKNGQSTDWYFDAEQLKKDRLLLSSAANQLAVSLSANASLLGSVDAVLSPVLADMSGLPLHVLSERLTFKSTSPDSVPVLIQDVITSGKTVLALVAKLRDSGVNVKKIVCLVNRRHYAPEMFESIGLEVHSLCTVHDN